MSEPQQFPQSGYRVRQMYSALQEHVLVDPTEAGDSEERQINVSWDWRINDPPQFEVLFGISIAPSTTIPERIATVMVGVFEADGAPSRVPLEEFVMANAIATLLPFVREVIANLSGRGPFSTYWLPLANAAAISSHLKFDAATGSRQLTEDPELKERLLSKSGTEK